MNVFSAVERLTAANPSGIRLEGDGCLRARDRRSTCAACLDLCPAGAIHAGRPPALDEEACAGCRACLRACPVSAFTSGDDVVTELLAAAARADATVFELLCDRHPRPAQGLEREALGLRVRGCLAGLGAGAYLALAAQGAQRLVVRAEACAACPWAALAPRVLAQAEQAQQLLAAAGRAERVTVQTVPLPAPVERPVQSTQSPPLSRRDLWRQLSRQGRAAVARAWPAETANPPGRMPGPDRRRVNQSMARLASPTGAAPAASAPSWSAPGWARVTASADCTACGVCARACPTGALRFEGAGSGPFALRFIPRSCVGCEVCVHVCVPAALTVDHAPTFPYVFGAAALYTLAAGELGQCARCHAPMAVRPGETLCRLCAHRQHSPLGLTHPPDAHDPPPSPEQPA